MYQLQTAVAAWFHSTRLDTTDSATEPEMVGREGSSSGTPTHSQPPHRAPNMSST